MNAFDIPARSCFAGDPEFQRKPQQHKGPELTLPRREKLARIKPEPKPRTGGRSGGRPVTVHIDRERLQALRDGGNSWRKCGEYFGCSGERARQLGAINERF